MFRELRYFITYAFYYLYSNPYTKDVNVKRATPGLVRVINVSRSGSNKRGTRVRGRADLSIH